MCGVNFSCLDPQKANNFDFFFFLFIVAIKRILIVPTHFFCVAMLLQVCKRKTQTFPKIADLGETKNVLL